jgi:hypothetical protein
VDLALDDELERGWRLICIGNPLSDCVLDAWSEVGWSQNPQSPLLSGILLPNGDNPS